MELEGADLHISLNSEALADHALVRSERRTSMPEYFISSDPKLINSHFVVRSLQTTYWGSELSAEVILASFAASLCFGVYIAGSQTQVGFARVVTDGATFSWLCDVFVDPAHRSRGLGKRLVAEAVAHPKVAKAVVFLGTKDAHTLYEQFGFVPWELMWRAP